MAQSTFLSRLLKPRDETYEPIPRRSHCAASLGGKVYVFAGYTDDFYDDMRSLSTRVETFDPYFEKWTQQKTLRHSPPGFINGAITASQDHLYHYGGADGTRRHSDLFRFQPLTLTWTRVCQHSTGCPMEKSGCRMVCCGNILCLFGGYGEMGFTDEFHLFDITKGLWSFPAITRTKPTPRINFSFTEIDNQRAVLFAGLQTGGILTNDTYLVDLRFQEWTKLDLVNDGPVPVERNGHAACCINVGDDHPLLLMTGGYGRGCVLNDVWLLDIVARRWKELTVPEGFQMRCFHSLTATSLAPGITVVTAFGGWRKWGGDLIAETTLLQFESCPPSAGPSDPIKWSLTDVTSNSFLGSKERVINKRRVIELAATRQHRVLALQPQAASLSNECSMLNEPQETLQVSQKQEEQRVQIEYDVKRQKGYSQLHERDSEAETQIYQQRLQEVEQQKQVLKECLQNAEAATLHAQQAAENAKQRIHEVTQSLQHSEERFVKLQKAYEKLRQENEYLHRTQQDAVGAALPMAQDSSPSSTSHPIYCEKPRLRDLIFIRWTDATGAVQRYRLRESVCTKWRTLGQTFGFPDGFLQHVYSDDPLKSFDAVFSRWLENGSEPPEEYPATWQGLISALEDVGGFRLKIKELCTALEKRSM